MTEFTERELTDAELAQVAGAGSSDLPCQTINLHGVDHISLSANDAGDLVEQIFFTVPETGGSTGS